MNDESGELMVFNCTAGTNGKLFPFQTAQA